MAKPVEPPKEQGVPEWMMTFGDCMSLLLTFFVMLISFTNFDEASLVDFMGTLKGGFEINKDLLDKKVELLQPEGTSKPVLLPVEDVASISPLSPTMRKAFRDIIDERFGKKIFLRRSHEGLSIIIESEPIFKKGGVELLPGNRNVFRSIGQLLEETDNEVRVTGVVPENAVFDLSIAMSPWGFAAKRAEVFKNVLLEESDISSDRFGTGTHVSSPGATIKARDGTREFSEYLEVLIAEKQEIRDVEPEEVVVQNRWL